MASYSNWQQRQLEADPAHDKRPAAMPTQSFDDWMRDQLAEQEREEIEALVDRGWTEGDARSFVAENPREGGES